MEYPDPHASRNERPTQTLPVAKRRRTRLTASCERCRSRKIRCDNNQPKCEACERAEAECDRSKPANRSRIRPSASNASSPACRSKLPSPTNRTAELSQNWENAYAPLDLLLSLSQGQDQSIPIERAMLRSPNFLSDLDRQDDRHNEPFLEDRAWKTTIPATAVEFSMPTAPLSTSPLLEGNRDTFSVDYNVMFRQDARQATRPRPRHEESILPIGNGLQLSSIKDLPQERYVEDTLRYRELTESTRQTLANRSGSRPRVHSTLETVASHTDSNTGTVQGQSSMRREEDFFIHSQDHRKKFLGASSSQVFVKYLDDESEGIYPSQHLKYGMSLSEELILPGQMESCHHPLPLEPDLETYVSTYYKTFHILYPIVEENWLRPHLTRPKRLQTATEEFVAPVVYLIISLGASMTVSSHQSSAVSRTYFDQAWKTLSIIQGRPFRSSVQAMLLLAIALRLRLKDGLAWQMIGSAIRISQSLGLHRYTVGPDASLDARIWYTTISLDAIGSLESGRPMTVRQSDYSTSLLSFKADTFNLGSTGESVNVLAALAELCQEIAYTVQMLFPTNPITSTDYEIKVLEHIGSIHTRLEAWAKALPMQLRPGGERPTFGPFFAYAAMLHMQYHQTMITLHRLSLIDHPRLVLRNLSHPRLQHQPFLFCLESGETICTQSARSILTCLDACIRFSVRHHYWTLHSVGTAIFALSLYTCKHPATWQAKADLELLSQATRYVSKSFLNQDLSSQFVNIYQAVLRMVEDRVTSPFNFDFHPLHSSQDVDFYGQAPGAEVTRQDAGNIEKLWSTLFDLNNLANAEVPQETDNAPHGM